MFFYSKKNSQHIQSQVDSDPEKLWKMNPNPWEQPLNTWSSNRQIMQENIEDGTQDGKDRMPTFFRFFRVQLICSIILFIAIIGAGQISNPWVQRGEIWLKSALNDQWNYSLFSNWYNTVFMDSPSFIPRFGDDTVVVLANSKEKEVKTIVTPIENGTLVRTFADMLSGIEIAAPAFSEVVAAQKGRVILVSDEASSVIVQHENERLTVYSKLGEVKVEVGDWLEAGDPVGRLPAAIDHGVSFLYFAMKQNDQYVDPLEVIPFE